MDALEHATVSRASADALDLTFFPHPGCIIRNLLITRKNGAVVLASAKTVYVQGSWLALISFTHRISLLRAEGLRITIPHEMPPPEPPATKTKLPTLVGRLVTDGAILEVGRAAPKPPLVFGFPSLELRRFSKNARVEYRVKMRHPIPPGTVTARGEFGPWNAQELGATAVSGDFEYTGADLGSVRGIAGTLSSKGSFRGTLGEIQTKGTATVPDFSVEQSRHRLKLTTEYTAVVNGLNGDVRLDQVRADLLRTTLWVNGTVASSEGVRGKIATLNFTCTRGRIEDLLFLFVRATPPSLRGSVTLRARAVLLPGPAEFFDRLRLDGDAGIDDAKFARSGTQRKIDELSSRARDDEDPDKSAPERVLSDLKGHVAVRNGVAHLSQIFFRVPGAAADGSGTFNLKTRAVNLHGKVAMEATVSETQSGIKSILLKPFDGLFKKKGRKAGAVLPVSITGAYPNPKYAVSLRPTH